MLGLFAFILHIDRFTPVPVCAWRLHTIAWTSPSAGSAYASLRVGPLAVSLNSMVFLQEGLRGLRLFSQRFLRLRLNLHKLSSHGELRETEMPRSSSPGCWAPSRNSPHTRSHVSQSCPMRSLVLVGQILIMQTFCIHMFYKDLNLWLKCQSWVGCFM